MKDLYSGLAADFGVETVVVTADANGASIDMQGYNSLMVIGAIGASGDTLSGSVYIELELEESDDDSTFTDVADADLQNSVTGTNTGTFAVINDPAEDSQVYKTGYKGTKRYVRPVVNVTGTHTNGTPIALLMVRGNAESGPVNL